MNSLRVSELNTLAQDALNLALGEDVWVTGEISGFRYHQKSGHMYFDLIEKSALHSQQYIAKVSCAFFQNSYIKWKASLLRQGFDGFELKDGMEVLLKAGVDLYIKEGRYQLIVTGIDPSWSLGAIARKRAQNIEALKTEGLINKNKESLLDECPLKIGLITSAGSAAYNDFISVLKASGYSFKIRLIDTHMQGILTPKEVISAIKTLEKSDVDLIAIVRGGGAKTDLIYFDDIDICRKIATCRKPVLTGIGHEIDLSVADIVSFRDFVTPTDTAKFIAARIDSFAGRTEAAIKYLSDYTQEIIDNCKQRQADATYNLTSIGRAELVNAYGDLQSLFNRFHRDISKELSVQSVKAGGLAQSLKTFSGYQLQTERLKIDRNKETIGESAAGIFSGQADKLKNLDNTLSILDPVHTLKRGFSITKSSKGALTTPDVIEGETITTLLYKGKIFSKVEAKES